MVKWMNRPLQVQANKSMELVKFNYKDASESSADLTEELIDEFKLLKDNPMNMISSVEGLQGSGKSWSVYDLIIKQFYHSGLDLNVDYVDYSITDKVKNVRETKKRVIHVLDEQVEFFGMGAEAIKAMLRNIEKVIRKYKQCFWFLSPEHIPHNCHYYFMTWEWGTNNPKWDFNIPLSDQWDYTKLLIFDRNYKWPFGHVLTGKPQDMNFVRQCEKKKDEFLDKLLEGTIGNPMSFVREKAEELYQRKGFKDSFENTSRLRAKRFLVGEQLGGALTMEQINTIVEILQEWFKKDKFF